MGAAASDFVAALADEEQATPGAPRSRRAAKRAKKAFKEADHAVHSEMADVLVETCPELSSGWVLRAQAGVIRGDGVSLVRAYCDGYHAVHLDPDDGFAWSILGRAQRLLGAPNAALASYIKAIGLAEEEDSRDIFKTAACEATMDPLYDDATALTQPLRFQRVFKVGADSMPLPATFRAGPDGPRRLDAVLTAVANARTTATDWVRFVAVPGKGVGVVAARDIPAGTVVHVEKAVLAATVPPAAGARICYHCMVPVPAATAVPCACDRVYCSVECMTAALQHYHAATCDASGGKADAALEEAARADAHNGVLTVLLPWKLLGWALTAAKSSRAPARLPTDMPPFVYMARATDRDEPLPPPIAAAGTTATTAAAAAATAAGDASTAATTAAATAEATAAAAEATAAATYMRIPSRLFLHLWALFHDQLGGDVTMVHMAPRWLLDAFTVVGTNAVVASGPDGAPVAALARGAACFNHSCEPNAAFAMDVATTGSQVSVVTSRAVVAGEEVTVSYVDVASPYATRRSILRSTRGFTCTCARCLAEASEAPASAPAPAPAVAAAAAATD